MANKDVILHVAIQPNIKAILIKVAREYDVSVSSLARVAIGQWILREGHGKVGK